jgi:hypothetical protein
MSGCGEPGCIFIYYQRSEHGNFKMNETIAKQLADHANAAPVYFNGEGSYSVLTPELTELVRLTVLSCIDEVAKQDRGMGDEWDMAVRTAKKAIYKKFGV